MHEAAVLPDPSTLAAMTAFLRANLVKTMALGAGAPFRAVAETAVRFNDTAWLWTDDNAKAAELLCEPAAYDADPATAGAAIDFVLRMSEGAVIQRRCAPPELRVVSADPAAVRVETAFFIVEGDLTRGALCHALRFNDNRTVPAACHAGGSIAFRHADQRLRQRIGATVCATAVEAAEGRVVLSHTSALHACRRAGQPATELGHVTFSYAIAAERSSIALTVTLTAAPGVTLDDVVVTPALDGLAVTRGVRYGALEIEGRRVRPRPGRRQLHSGAASHAAVVQENGSPGFAYAMHLRLHDGARLRSITGSAGWGGRFRALDLRYGLGRVAAAPVVLREDRLLTGGGYYDAAEHYHALMRRDAAGGTIDPSMSYDIGAELNAVAVHLLFASRGAYATPVPAARIAALTAWYDRHLDLYFGAIQPGTPGDLRRLFTRGLAFVALSLDCMVRATGHPRHRERLAVAVALILRLARRPRWPEPGGGHVFADAWAPKGCFLDCHAACLLALARAARHGDPAGALGRAIHGGIAGIRLFAGQVRLSKTHQEAYEGLAVRQRRIVSVHVDTGFWTFKLGLVLRALHAVERAAAAGAIPLRPADRDRLATRLRRAEAQLGARCRRHGATIEVLTSPIANETNSETQPWAALGFVPTLDAAIEGLAPPAIPFSGKAGEGGLLPGNWRLGRSRLTFGP